MVGKWVRRLFLLEATANIRAVIENLQDDLPHSPPVPSFHIRIFPDTFYYIIEGAWFQMQKKPDKGDLVGLSLAGAVILSISPAHTSSG